MGHLINPISTRLSFTSFWFSNWSCYDISNFSYNLMLDNLVRNLILWAFANNRVSSDLTIVGAFLSHFKVVRRGNHIRVFVYLLLDSSSILKSQSVEIDPAVRNMINSLNAYTMNSTDESSDLSLLDSSLRPVFRLANDVELSSSIPDWTRFFLSNYLSQFLSELFSIYSKKNKHFSSFNWTVDPVFLKMNNFVKAQFLSRFISRRLSYGFELSRVLNPIVQSLQSIVDSRASTIKGFKISCNGRFNKAQMASHTWEKYGPVPLNNFSCAVDYSFSKVFLKYGACGIKVWIFHFNDPFKSFKAPALERPVRDDLNNLIYSSLQESTNKFYNFSKVKGVLLLLKLFSENYQIDPSVAFPKILLTSGSIEPASEEEEQNF